MESFAGEAPLLVRCNSYAKGETPWDPSPPLQGVEPLFRRIPGEVCVSRKCDLELWSISLACIDQSEACGKI